jgi:YD repeat-containing protein
MSAVRDPGRDGDLSLGGNTHAKVATDAFGYTLGYFAGDYNPIGTFTTASKSEASTAGSDLLAARSDLWNGNISHMVTCLPKASDYATNQTITPEAFGSAYQYDQLNRLSSSRAFTNINTTTNQWQSGAGTNPTAYATDYTYDAMGNILTQKRNGGGTSATALDELTYNYHTTTDGLVSNRLYHVDDVVSAGNYTDDIDDQGTFNNTHSTIETANNYGYDELGNLVRDAQEEIASIEWTVYGKMKKITRNSGSSKADLEFGYDASGNRLWKKVIPKGSGAVTSTYYYLRDAQGNEMCRYVKYTNTSSQLMYVAQEHSIYGSSRVGVDNRKDTLYKGGSYSPAWGGASTSRRNLGSKSFELANHLGNVLVTLSDKPIYQASSGVVYFNPEISSISDYYPFGAPIQGRGYSTEAYRFGFNNQEKDDEVAGPGNHNTATFWEYDTRLGRRWNQDPVVKPWESLYACLSDNPILLNDPDGDDYGLTTKKDQDGKITHVKVSAKIFINGDGASANRATELTMSAKETYKTETVDGVEVSFDIQYVYDPKKTTGDLNSKLEENLLIFNKRAEPDNGPERSHINSYTYPPSPIKYTGNNGVINGSGKSNFTVLHESLHLIGLSDRYGANGKANIGYENDIMGAWDKMTLNISHYRNIIEYTQNQHNLLIPKMPNLKYLYSNKTLDLKYEGGKAILKR